MSSGRKNGAQGRTATFMLGMFLASVLAAMPISMAGPSGTGYGFYDYSGACYDILTDTNLTENVFFTSGSCILKGNLTIPVGFTMSLKGTTITHVEPAPAINTNLTVNGSLLLDHATLTKPALPYWTLTVNIGGDLDILNGSLLEGANNVQINNGTAGINIRESRFSKFRAPPFQSTSSLVCMNCIGVNVINNTFENATQILWLSGGKSNVFIGNTFSNATWTSPVFGGVHLYNEADAIFENTRFKNMSTVCLWLQIGSSARLLNSTITGCNIFGDIIVEYTSNLYILNTTYYGYLKLDPPPASFENNSHVFFLVGVEATARWESDGSLAQNASLNVLNVTGEMVYDRLMGPSAHIDFIELLLDEQYRGNLHINHTPHRFVATAWGGDRDITGSVDQDIYLNRSIVVTLDNVLPLLNITSPANGTFTNKTNIRVNGTTDASTPLKPVANNVTFRTGNLVLYANALASGHFEYDVPLPKEGDNAVAITVKDQVGNNVTGSLIVRRDTVPPFIIIDEPVDGSLTNAEDVMLSGMTEPGSNLTYQISIPGSTGPTVPVTVASNGSFSTTIHLEEGVNTITFKAQDRAKNSNSTTLKVTLDTIAPVIVIIQPSKLPFVTNKPVLKVVGNANLGAEHLFVDGTEVVMDGVRFETDVTLKEGLNAITIAAVDRAGNEAQMVLNATLDMIPPALTILEPMDGQYLATKNAVVKGLTEPGAEVYINGTKKDVLPDGSFNFERELKEGLNILGLTAKDPAGNIAEMNITLYRDTIAPILSVTGPKDGLATNMTLVSVEGTTDIDASVTVNGQNATMGNGTFTCIIALVDGLNTIRVVARDRAGNEAEISLNITVDTFVNLTLGAIPGKVEKQMFEVKGTTDRDATVTINDIPVRVEADGSFALAITLNEGDNTFVVKATDTYGNTLRLTGKVVYEVPKDDEGTDMGAMVILPAVSIVLIILGITLLIRLRSKRKGKGKGGREGEDKEEEDVTKETEVVDEEAEVEEEPKVGIGGPGNRI